MYVFFFWFKDIADAEPTISTNPHSGKRQQQQRQTTSTGGESTANDKYNPFEFLEEDPEPDPEPEEAATGIKSKFFSGISNT